MATRRKFGDSVTVEDKTTVLVLGLVPRPKFNDDEYMVLQELPIYISGALKIFEKYFFCFMLIYSVNIC